VKEADKKINDKCYKIGRNRREIIKGRRDKRGRRTRKAKRRGQKRRREKGWISGDKRT
jgi:hypothetical protein